MSDERDTDRGFARAVAAALRDSLVQGGPDCPEPGLLAAFLAGRLEPVERDALESHLSVCDACQTELAMLVRIEPAPAGAAGEPVATSEAPSAPGGEPETALDVPDSPVRGAPEAVDRPPAPRRVRPMRWLAAPLALAATAVLGVLLTHRLAPDVPEIARRASGIAKKPASDPAERRDLDSARNEREQVAGAPAAPPAAVPVETAPPAESDTAKTAEQAPADAAERALGGTASGTSSKDESAANAVTRAAGEAKAAAKAAPSEEAAPVQRSAPPAAQAQAKPESGGVLADAERAKLSQLEKGVAEVPSPPAAAPPPPTPAEPWIRVPGEPSVVWRVRGATIERSDDGGTTWRTQTVARSPLTTGAAVSAEVCWLVGTAGTVLRTVDGSHWTRVTAPGAADVVSVSATSASSATVTLADGARRSTDDGGRSWSKP